MRICLAINIQKEKKVIKSLWGSAQMKERRKKEENDVKEWGGHAKWTIFNECAHAMLAVNIVGPKPLKCKIS
jgi:hypothetical protein